MDAEPATLDETLDAVRRLADRERHRCLWFLREGELISGPESAALVLAQIAKHGDLDAFRRAERLKAWLSRHSSERS